MAQRYDLDRSLVTTFKRRTTAGTWENIDPASVKVKWGTVWRDASEIRVGWGGRWYNTEYRGKPVAIARPELDDFGYAIHHDEEHYNNYMTILWRKPTQEVRADITGFDVRLRGPKGGTIQNVHVAQDEWPMRHTFRQLAWDVEYTFDVLSYATGIPAPEWSPTLVRNMNHPR